MEKKTFEIVKINRTWIEALLGNYSCKIKVSDETKDFVIGSTIDLLVEDISIRSKYGTDLRYEVKASVKEEKIFLSAPYNANLVKSCHELGGTWDSDANVWVFESFLADKVEELELKYASKFITVEITAKNDLSNGQDSIKFLGYPICYATSRDSGAKTCKDVAFLRGEISSGGSQKNWSTEIAKGSVFRLKISEPLWYKDKVYERFDVKLIEVSE